jgi:hypothetical protein
VRLSLDAGKTLEASRQLCPVAVDQRPEIEGKVAFTKVYDPPRIEALPGGIVPLGTAQALCLLYLRGPSQWQAKSIENHAKF